MTVVMQQTTQKILPHCQLLMGKSCHAVSAKIIGFGSDY